jgi:hypothetical protein
VCTVDSAAAASWGKLWVEYDITLHTPQLPSGGSSFSTVSTVAGVAPLSSASIFGVAGAVAGNLGVTAAVNTVTVPNLIVGAEYEVSCSIVGTVITAFAFNLSSGFNLKTTVFSGFPAAATSANSTVTLTAAATSGVFIYTCTATTVTATDLIVALIPTSGF